MLQAVILLVGLLMLAQGILIGVFHKTTFISPANGSLFFGLTDSAKRKLCRKFCVVPLVSGVILIAAFVAGRILELPRNAYLIPLVLLLALTMFDFNRVSGILNKLRTHTFNEKIDL